MSTRLIALIGAGPSLDYARGEIERLAAADALFLVSDSVAAAFVKLYPRARAVVFTVEPRRHAYLARLAGNEGNPTAVMAYQKAHDRNLRGAAQGRVTRFKIAGEPGDLIELYSPGTVLGVMLAYAVQEISPPGEIHLIGADFSYIDNQVYSRFILPHAPATHRLATYETWQLEMAFKKTGGFITRGGFAIRTGFELMRSRENMREMLERIKADLHFVEYSPVGFDCDRVEKRIPVSG